MTPTAQDIEAQNFIRCQQLSMGIFEGISPEFYDYCERGWQAVYSALFDEPGKPFVSVLGEHHAEALAWHWQARLALLNGETPDYWAYFPIWSRGHMKSTIARYVAIVDALLTIAYGEQGYILYISRNKTMAEKHASSIETLLTSPRIRRFCPSLCEVKRSETTGQSKGWKSTFLNTRAGIVFHFGGLDEGLAGGNVDGVRPTFIVPDDIDGREDSPVIGESRFQKLTTEVLPMRQANTLTFWAQNLISRYTAMFRIQSGQERVLTDRKPTEPIKAVIDLKTQVKTIDGIVKDIIVGGIPTWRFYDLKRCQEEINTIGLPAFKRECQHEVEQSKEGLIAHNYDDAVQVISESEFARIFGSKDAWKNWSKYTLNDWARTKTDKHANVASFLTISAMNTKFPGATFIVNPMSFPANAEPEDIAERFLSALTPYAYHKITWQQLRRDAMMRLNADRHTKSVSDRIKFERSNLQTAVKKHSSAVLKAYKVKGGTMGHSDDGVIKIYNNVYGFRFQPVNPGKHGGVEKLNQEMMIDYDMPHPFRPFQKGYSRWFIVVPDDTDATPINIEGVLVYPPRKYPLAVKTHDLHDSDLLRYQLSNWRYREPKLTESGEIIDDPLKMFDDFGQMLQMFYCEKNPQNDKLNTNELIHEAMDSTVRQFREKPTMDKGEQLAYEDEYRATKKKIKRMKDPNLNTFGDYQTDYGEMNSRSDQPDAGGFGRDTDNGFDDIYYS